jgi:hypothetical protein
MRSATPSAFANSGEQTLTNRRPLPWPPWVLALDVFGTLLVAAGLFGVFGGIEPEGLDGSDVKALSITLIVVGALLTLPFVVAIIRGTGQRQHKESQ